MPPQSTSQPLFTAAEVLAIAPEVLLAIWGLLVLVVDFSFLRKAPSMDRARILGRLTQVGLFAGLGLGIVALLPGSAAPGPLKPFAMDLIDMDWTLFAGTIAADAATAWLNLVILTLLSLVVGMSMTWDFTEAWGEYFALLLWAGAAMMLLIASEELLTLFLSLETMTLCLYIVAAFEKTRRRSAEAGLKYFVYGSVASALFLFGLSLIYGLTGTTRLEAIGLTLGSTKLHGLGRNLAGATALLLVMVGFGFKIAAVPFQQWAPDTYQGAPAPVTAWIATGSKIASFAALLKVLMIALPSWASSRAGVSGDWTTPGWIGLVAVISAASMTYGNLAALAQKNLKRMLAYSSIAHAGYLLVGVLAAAVSVNRGAAAGAVLYYLVIYAFTTAGALASAAWLARDKGSDEISDLDGLGSRSPALAVCLVLMMLSLIGMPPLAGFFGKFSMFMEAMNTGQVAGPQAWVVHQTLTWLVALGLLNSVVSAFYYVRVLKAMFLRPEQGKPMSAAPAGVVVPIVFGTAVAVGLGLYPAPLVETMRTAALPLLASGAAMTKSTAIDPTSIKSDQERQKILDQRNEEDIKAGRVFKVSGAGR